MLLVQLNVKRQFLFIFSLFLLSIVHNTIQDKGHKLSYRPLSFNIALVLGNCIVLKGNNTLCDINKDFNSNALSVLLVMSWHFYYIIITIIQALYGANSLLSTFQYKVQL